MASFKLEIALAAITLFISVIYLGVKRQNTVAHKIYIVLLVMSYIVIGLQITTLYTVNHLSTVDALFNEIVHKCFISSLMIYFAGTTIYIWVASTNMCVDHFIKSKRAYLCLLPIAVPVALCFLLPIEYSLTPYGNYSTGPAAYVAYVSIPIYMAIAIWCLMAKWSIINKKKKPLVIYGFAGIVLLAFFQFMVPSMCLNGVGVVILDITLYLTVENPDVHLIERLEYEKNRADDANNAKSAFLANMSHEIRTPMNAIVGITEILLRTELDPQQKSYLRNIKQSGKSLLLIINDILDFSKIEAGKMELVDEEYDSVSMVNDVSMIILNRIGDRPIELIFDVDSQIPKRLYGDMGRIKQIIINLMNNAVKFTEEGYVKLSVHAVKSPLKTECNLFFEVEDTGQGIKEEDLGKVFDSFQQVDVKHNRNKEGTGLGLAICKQLTHMMGGSISVESEYGKGSVFKFFIKQRIVDAAPLAVVKDEIYDNECPSIGICSDNPIVNDYSREMIQGFGFDCVLVKASELMTSKADHIFIDGCIYEENKELVRQLSEEGRYIAVLQDPMRYMIAAEGIEVINKPFYSYNFCQFLNHEEQEDVGNETVENTRFTAPSAQILIVDDNDINLKVAKGLFAPLNMNMSFAKSGKEAIAMARNTKYDIIFMDHMMPVMDGVEATKFIRNLEAFDSYYQYSPIVALTANVSNDAREQFAEVGVTELLGKPIDLNAATATIKHLLPEDLIKHGNETASKDSIDIKGIPKISGLNVLEGIKNSGSKEMFESLLGDFYNIIDMKSNKIKKCLEDSMIKEFIIEVHALKNTARMIGADKLSNMFRELEEMGRGGDVEGARNLTYKTLELMTGYKDTLRPYAMAAAREKKQVSKAYIIEALNGLVQAVEEFDLDSCDSWMETLETYRLNDSCDKLMEELRAYVSDVAMEDIINTSKKMVELIKEDENLN